MKYINLLIDVEGLKNNGLHVYKKTTDGLEKLDNGHFVIVDEIAKQSGLLEIPSDFTHPEYILKQDVTPKQYNNILFFETLKAFRR